MLNKLHTRLVLMLIACFLFCFFILNNKSYAQYLGSYHLAKQPMKISVGVGGGILSYDGDIGVPKGSALTNSKLTLTPGYKITVDQRFGNKTRFVDLFGIQFNFIKGELAGEDLRSARTRRPLLNFESPIYQADLNLIVHFERLLNFNRRSRVSPYLSVGIGYLHFHPYTDLFDANGNPHWKGTTQVSPVDHEYETDLRGYKDFGYNNSNFSLGTFSIPIGIGIEYNFSYYLKVKLDYVLYPTGSDWIDGKNSTSDANQHNDWFKFRSISILYTFGKPTMKYSHKRVRSRF